MVYRVNPFTGKFDNIGTPIASTGVTPATYGAAGAVSQFTVGSDGRLTYAANVTIAISQSQIYDLAAVLSRAKVIGYIEGIYA